ncbi:MAG TPA: aldo/keto reductase [Myxococcota bacterium]|jgi:predicted aldo/keto reductase-like oxidoreductase|nr:aldo/keto reductase [Myxococcota bacterium]
MRRRPFRVFLACLAVALVVGFFFAGPMLYKAAIGLDRSAFPLGGPMTEIGRRVFPEFGMSLGGLAWVVASLLGVAGAGFLAVRRAARRPAGLADPGRRGMVAGLGGALAALAVGGVATWLRAFKGVGNEGRGWAPQASEIFNDAGIVKTAPDPRAEWQGSRVQAYRTLGRTGWRVSDIVLGTGAIRGVDGEQVARLALERGVNYFDTAPDYSGSGSEQAMGRAMKAVGRDQIFIATKFCTPEGHLPPGTPVAEYKRVIEDSLRRLDTDHVDLVHVHSCDEVERLLDPNAHEAFDRLKEEGKARFLGFSSHTPNLVEVASRAIDSGRFDVMMLAYHHGIWPEIPSIIRRARTQQDMGVVAMKTLKGARHRSLPSFLSGADAYSQAAFKWVLSNADVSCLVVSFSKLQHVDEYLFASGKSLSRADAALLEEYDRQILGSYCAPHCGRCLEACPEDLPIHDVLRYRMYFEDYGREKDAIRLYSALTERLGKNADVCAGCSGPCLGSCPVGIAIPQRMSGAHDLLTLG